MSDPISAIVAAVKAVGSFLASSSALSALVRVGIGLAVSALTAPRAPKGNSRAGTTFNIRQASPSRRIPYGVSRIGGIYGYVETTGDDLEDIYIVFLLGDGPIQSIDKMFFDAQEVILETNGILIGADESYARDLARFNNLYVRVSLKACNQTEFSAVTGAIPEGFQLQLQALESLARFGANVRQTSWPVRPARLEK